jgi:hypothetical protein
MPNNTNPLAVTFVDGHLRPFADRLAQLYFEAKKISALYDGRNLGEAIMPSNSDPIGETGSDGRPVVTGNLALGIIYRANEFVADYEANNKAKLVSVLLVAPNPS